MSWPKVRACKMSGAGNDFVVVRADESERLGDRLVEWTRAICRRGVSIGADGVLVVGGGADSPVTVRFLNPDGSEAFCGNGSRCAARFAALQGLAGRSMVLATSAGLVPADVLDHERVRLRLPVPRTLGTAIVTVGGTAIEGCHVDAGSPHFVVAVPDVAGAPLERWGPVMRRAEIFAPAGVNVDLIATRSDGGLEIRTWERGVEGETLSCGSGAIAAAAAARLRHPRRTVFEVLPRSHMPLTVRFVESDEQVPTVEFEGDARVVFEGLVTAEALRGTQPGSSSSSPPAST